MKITETKNLKKLLNLLIFLLSINSCGSDEARIQDLLNKRWIAIETKNINLYKEVIADDYPGGENFLSKIEENFKKIQSIRVISQKPAIYINNDTATVYQEVRLVIRVNENTQDLETREKLILRKTSKGWRITGGLE